MTKTQFKLVLFATTLCLSCEAMAQTPVALATRKMELQALAGILHQRDALDRQQASIYARRLGIPVRRELPDGRVLELQRYKPGKGAVFYITNNVDAADTVSTDEVWPGGSAGLNLDGAGMSLAQWDGGAIYPDHPDFAGRLTQADGATIVSGHSTHVAGTLFGAGAWLVPGARGMAYAADLEAYDWNSDTAEMAAAAAAGELISNHSYGIAAGWIYIGGLPPDTWWWIGGDQPSDVEDPYFGYYDSETQLWDQIAFDAPYYLIIKASGNDRTDIGPAPGELYWVIDQDGNGLFTSTLPRNPDCFPLGYDCLPTASVAKNILVVGAVDDVLGGYSPLAGPSAVQMAEFSSWGPSDDGRIKPDLVGNGMFLMSTWPDSPFFAAAAGTSMAAPNVTGSLLLLQQHYENLHGGGNFMRAATLKALAIHTADEAGDDDGPDYAFGWGLLNTQSAAKIITEDGGDHQIIEGTLSDGGTDSIPVNVSLADAVLHVTLVWADPPGTPPPLSVDPSDLMLVNDLDLRITKGGSTYFPWILDPANPSAAATTGDNFRDNVEQVRAAGGTGNYTIEVSHKGALQGGPTQDYSLIISARPPPPTGSGLLINENFTDGLPAGWTIFLLEGIPWTINTPVPGDSRLDNNTAGTGKFAMVDSNYGNETETHLRTPVMDLSANTAAVLRFQSQYNYDTFESLNVDVSTDGGSSWGNAWTFQGFNPFPTQYVLDLTGVLAGESAVMLRWRFDSNDWYSGDYWQVDNIQFEVFGGGSESNPPDPASGPSPADSASNVGINDNLSWSAGAGATTRDVYFGTSSPGGFQGNQGGTSFNPGTMSYSTTYYWRIDEVNDDGTTPGAVWSFSTETAPLPDPPAQASGPSPANGANPVGVNDDLSWSAGAGATSHAVYFGTSSPGGFQGNQGGTSFEPGTLLNDMVYFWRIDEVNAGGTTPGAVWSFTTEAAAPPPGADSVHLDAFSGSAIPGSRGKWTASVDIMVENQDNVAEPGVTVEGSWSNGTNGSGACTDDDGDGLCTVQKGNLKNQVGSVMFTVTNLVKTGMPYMPSENNGPDNITVNKNDVDQTPSASNDSFQTDIDQVLNGNVMNNDNQGDGPASINSNTTTSNGILSLDPDGFFIYTPNSGYDGSDSFNYSIIDQDGDVSNTATASITVSAVEPPPSGGLTVNTRPYKVKGKQWVELTWEGFAGGSVEITRDGSPIPGSPIGNDGAHDDNIGAKGGGQVYLYEVCESGTSNCASASAAF